MRDETKILDKLKNSARRLKQNIYVLHLTYKDPRVPWYVKLFVILDRRYPFYHNLDFRCCLDWSYCLPNIGIIIAHLKPGFPSFRMNRLFAFLVEPRSAGMYITQGLVHVFLLKRLYRFTRLKKIKKEKEFTSKNAFVIK
jgi:hypothetical protein